MSQRSAINAGLDRVQAAWQSAGPAPRPKPSAERQRAYARTEAGEAARKRYKGSEKGRASKRATAARKRDERWLTRPFVGWDGEGVTRDDGSHDYLLLANSRGHAISSVHRLSTERIFRFLLEKADSDAINVIYGASYDWNMWLGDLTEDELRELYQTGELKWNGFLIRWRPGKTFHLFWHKRSVLFYDVISFFQTSFVNACDSYLGEAFQDRDLIVENKRLRSGFRAADLREIARYNTAELINLVNLMTELRARLHAAGLKPTRWDGPGAIAVALMSREGVPSHLQQPPVDAGDAIRRAYFGGRFQVVKFGHVEKPAYEYDVNSAYPYALQFVPSLAGGTWEHVSGDPGPQDFAVYHVLYDGTERMRLDFPQPFPVRHANGSVAYPVRANGWYWSPEVEVGREYVRMHGGRLKVVEAWVFHPATDEKPFAYVGPLFEQRRVLKRAGDGAHVGIKLGLNSQYGKLAQQVGWRIQPDGSLRIPPYHQLEWAGYVTAMCRSMVLRAALPNLRHVIAWETDALFTDEPLDLNIGSALGEWEATEFRDLTYLQSGMYFATAADGAVVEKTRGVDKGSVTRTMVLERLANGETHIPASLTRFTGAGIALQSRFQHWRRWEVTDKNVALFPDGKTFHPGCSACGSDGTFTLGVWHSTLITPRAGYVSQPYPIGWINPDPAMSELEELRMSNYESDLYND